MASQPGSSIEADSIGMSNGKYIFIDTNLNTTAIVHASFTDTTFHIKEKLLAEHLRVNPSIGLIQIRALKVKRKGQFYIMPDNLPVSEMFHKAKKTWYLTADCDRITSTNDLMVFSYHHSPMTQGCLNTKEGVSGLLSENNIVRRSKNKRKNEETLGLIEWYANNHGDETLVPFTRQNSEALTAKDLNLSISDTVQEVKPERRKRKKSKKNDAEVQDVLHLEQAIRQGECIEPFVNAVEKEDEGSLLLTIDDKAMELSQRKTVDCVENELEKKLTSATPDQSEVSEREIADGSECKKRRRRRKNVAGINLEKPALEQANNGANVSPVLHNFDNTEEVQIKQSDDDTKKKNIGNENQFFDTPDANFAVLANENETVESNQAEETSEEVRKSKKKKRKSRASASDAQENSFKDQKNSAEVPPLAEENGKLASVNEGEINIVIFETEQTLEDDDTKQKNMENDAAAFPVLEKENEILESNQADRHKKGDTAKKSKKKKKKSRVTESEVQEIFSIEGANITSSEGNVKLVSGNGSEINIVISQTKHTLEDDVPIKDNNGNNADIPLLETGNYSILESNQADKSKKDEGEKGKKSNKKRKKSQVTESDVQEKFPTKGSNITSSEENDKLPTVDENEANIVISQTEQNLEYDGTDKENMESDAGFPVLEKESKILESSREDEINKDEGVTGRKSRKKRKKTQVSESDVQENFPVKGSGITSSGANEELPICNEHESKIVITEQILDDDGTKKKSMVSDADCLVSVKEKEIFESNLADRNNEGKGNDKKSKKKRKKVTVSNVQENFPIMDETLSAETKDDVAIKGACVVTDDHGIDFKLHFVHKNTQLKVASDDNVKVTSQLNAEKETARNVKKDVLQSVSALSDLPKSPRSSDEQDSENKSGLKEGATGMRIADSKLVLKTPQNKSLLMKPQAPIQDCSKNSIAKMTLMKTPETKNVFLKSGSIFKDRSFITNNMKLMKTPQKKNLFTKPGSIFHDNAVADEVGDNGRIVTSDSTTDYSSGSSSESDYSDGESEMSDNLNGSNDGKGISDSGMLEMRKILRNSAQFKKAKLIASQTEPEPDELDLTSQPEP